MRHIHNCCVNFLRDPEEISMLESEVLEKVWTKRHLFSGSHNDFKAWVFTITRNTFISKYNKGKSNRIEDIDTIYDQPRVEFDVEDDIDNKKRIADILYTVEMKFKKDYVDIFKANVIEGKKYEECVKEFGYPMGTVKNVIHTIRKYISDNENIISEKKIIKTTVRSGFIIPRTRIINLLIRIRNKYNKLTYA